MGHTQRAHDPDEYAQAIADFEALRAIIPKFREARAFIRVSEPLSPIIRNELSPPAQSIGANRDRVVCALVNKGCNTHAAVRTLTDAGHGDDAMALSRVLHENAGLLLWLLIDPIYRLELYAISDALYQRRWRELVAAHFGTRPDLVAGAKAAVDAKTLAIADFFGNTVHRWAQVLHPDGGPQRINFEAMMKENAEIGGSQSTFQHDVIYFLHSAFVHSTAHSMRSFRRLRIERYFTAELGPNNRWCFQALAGSNMFLLQLLHAAARYLGLSAVESSLDEVFDRIKQRVTPETHVGPVHSS